MPKPKLAIVNVVLIQASVVLSSASSVRYWPGPSVVARFTRGPSGSSFLAHQFLPLAPPVPSLRGVPGIAPASMHR